MTHSAAMAAEILPGKTVMEALNTDLVCDAINTAMRELFLQIVYGRSQSAFSEGGLVIGAGMEDPVSYTHLTLPTTSRVRFPRQDDRLHQGRHGAERGVQEVYGYIRQIQ